MPTKSGTAPVRILSEDVVNKIAAGEVVERPASVVKELVENALDACATRILVRLVAAGRRTVEVVDNGHGMAEHDALLAIERHATSKIRKAEDLDNIVTMGFRGEALASIAAVSRFEMITRRAKDPSGTRIRIEGGVLRDVSQVAAPVGTRVTVNRLYFNTPVRAKFLKGITTELSHCIDIVQRHALAEPGVGFEVSHNDKVLLGIPENANLRERVALIWGLSFVKDLIEMDGEGAGIRIRGMVGTPGLTRSQRSHQFFFMNRRPVMNRALQYGFEDAYRGLLTIGRHPVGILMVDAPPRFVDVNIHPAKRELRFRDERVAQAAVRDIVRDRLAAMDKGLQPLVRTRGYNPLSGGGAESPATVSLARPPLQRQEPEARTAVGGEAPSRETGSTSAPAQRIMPQAPRIDDQAPILPQGVQTEFVAPVQSGAVGQIEPEAVYQSVGSLGEAPLQVFGTYLLVPAGERLLIIDQHALHERLMYDGLRAELEDTEYESQRLAVPILIDLPPSHVRVLEANLGLFSKLGIEIEPFGGATYQVTAVCHLYDEGKIADAVYHILDEAAQGNLFERADFMADFLRLAVEACRGAVKAGDRLSPRERRNLLEGFRRLRPPYTCPHGRPIITELTQIQVEKSFRRRQ